MREPIKQFFGDAEYSFHLEPDLVIELERRLGSGIGTIFRRFLSSDFHFSDLCEVLRLGLIGGGMDPKDASTLVTIYGARLTIAELYHAALPVLDSLMIGVTVQPVAKPAEGTENERQ